MGKKIVFLLAALFFVWVANGQNTTIKGVVTDSITGERLSYVSLKLKGTTIGAASDENGLFSFSSPTADRVLEVSYLGYDRKEITVTPGVTNNLKIQLAPNGITLNEVTIKPQKEKYSKKENPAVTFVRQVIALRENNAPHNHDYFRYDRYEKMVFAMNEYEPKPKKTVRQASSISWSSLLIRSMRVRLFSLYRKRKEWRRFIIGKVRSRRNVS